jgi:hypothetical protein
MAITIVGAGMAGLLAARMLRHRDPVVVEAQESLPNNHSAVLRFRSPAVGDVLGIPFRRVSMTKAVVPWRNPVADALAYARKVSGVSRSDRSLPLAPEVADRWIAPPDLVERMARGVEIKFSTKFDFNSSGEKVISTIPMPSLMSSLDFPGRSDVVFVYAHGWNVRAKLNMTSAYVSLYVPSPDHSFSRVSITGDELIVEYSRPISSLASVEADIERSRAWIVKDVESALALLGLPATAVAGFPVARVQRYAKILPIDDEARRAFIFWASSVRGAAYQLGRYATWRPGLLMDDLVKDVRTIDAWIEAGAAGGYAMDLHEAAKRRGA